MSATAKKSTTVEVSVGSAQLLEMYATMVRIREFENRMTELFLAGKLPGFLHLYIGEEAVAVGVMAALRDDDYITSTHRGHGHLLAKGGDPKLMMAELFGRATGYCGGKGGSMHIADPDLGILGANGIVGAGLPLAAGAALACQYRHTDAVAACFFGDGASNRGTFLEALNLAALWKLPVVYVCENNHFGEWSRQDQQAAVCDIAGRGTALGVPGVAVDGNDVEAVYVAAEQAVARARRGEGPSLIECKTWRHGPHSIGEPLFYRDEATHQAWLEKDPLPRCAAVILDRAAGSQEDLDRITAEAQAEMLAAAEFGEAGPLPDVADLTADVYSG